MTNLKIRQRAISTIEYSLLIVVCIFAFIGVQYYLKRGMEGGWRRQIDQMAGQYSSGHENTTTVVTESSFQTELQASGITNVSASQSAVRITDERIDSLNSETRIGI